MKKLIQKILIWLAYKIVEHIEGIHLHKDPVKKAEQKAEVV